MTSAADDDFDPQMIGLAVIARAFYDLHLKNINGSTAAHFFTRSNPLLAFWCDVGNVDVEQVLTAVERRVQRTDRHRIRFGSSGRRSRVEIAV